MAETPSLGKNTLTSCAAFERLLNIMSTLRSPNGCPWDAQQTPENLKPYLIEEVYEVLEALDRDEPPAIRDELGDLLLQIVFHARIFEERGLFSMTDVINAISDKLIRRHPHVFAGSHTGNAQMLETQWDQIKTEENRARGKSASLLGNIPRHLPSLQKAGKLAAKIFPSLEPLEIVLNVVQKNLHQLTTPSGSETKDTLENRFGTLLFNLARMGNVLHIDAEDALRKINNRMIEEHKNATTASGQKN
jgi:tetrapyrrole methylase family protein/MazG family protein/ATP diphosphatase